MLASTAALLSVKDSVDREPDLTADLRELEDEWEVPESRLIVREVLGKGAFGVVRKGLLKGDSNDTTPLEVAVKMMKENASTEEKLEFHQEIELMKAIGRHPHVVSIIGCCTAKRMLITELCSLRDLHCLLGKELHRLLQPFWRTQHSHSINYNSSKEELVKYARLLLSSDGSALESLAQPTLATLVTNKLYELQNDTCFPDGDPLNPTDLLSFARQVAMGMEFLAGNRVVHRDLAARNVLVCGNRTVKISDFGLSRDVYEQNVYCKTTNGKLPIKWMAIESLLLNVYTTQSDVWSFGVLMWEIVTLGKQPYADTDPSQMLKLLRAGYRMERPSNCGAELYRIMADCWEAKCKERPTFTQLFERLDALLASGSHHRYLNLEFSPDDETEQDLVLNVK